MLQARDSFRQRGGGGWLRRKTEQWRRCSDRDSEAEVLSRVWTDCRVHRWVNEKGWSEVESVLLTIWDVTGHTWGLVMLSEEEE